jgi:hypothetical protein
MNEILAILEIWTYKIKKCTGAVTKKSNDYTIDEEQLSFTFSLSLADSNTPYSNV